MKTVKPEAPPAVVSPKSRFAGTIVGLGSGRPVPESATVDSLSITVPPGYVTLPGRVRVELNEPTEEGSNLMPIWQLPATGID